MNCNIVTCDNNLVIICCGSSVVVILAEGDTQFERLRERRSPKNQWKLVHCRNSCLLFVFFVHFIIISLAKTLTYT